MPIMAEGKNSSPAVPNIETIPSSLSHEEESLDGRMKEALERGHGSLNEFNDSYGNTGEGGRENIEGETDSLGGLTWNEDKTGEAVRGSGAECYMQLLMYLLFLTRDIFHFADSSSPPLLPTSEVPPPPPSAQSTPITTETKQANKIDHKKQVSAR